MSPDMSPDPIRPRVSLDGGRAAYVGPGLDLAPHRNAAATVAVALDAPFRLDLGEGAREGLIALIPPGARHHLRAAGPMAFLYLDALGDDHRRLRGTELGATRARLAGEARRGGEAEALCAALGIPPRPAPDARIAAAVRRLDERPQDFPHVADAARLAGLSPSRFQALLREAVGMPFRRYRLWRRMAVVARGLAAGESLTATALEAGFSGSAHLSAAFRAMFGLAPSRLAALGVAFTVGRPARDAPPDVAG